MPDPRPIPLLSPSELAGLLAGERDVLVLEVGDHTDEPELAAAYAVSHVPGAHFASFAGVLRGERTGSNGNGPLPDPGVLQEHVRAWGVRDDTTVVVYGRGRPAPVTRAWFVLRWAGVDDVRYLDGGWDAWIGVGQPVSPEVAPRQPSSFVVRPGSVATLIAAEAADTPERGVLLDARGSGAFTAGHIPGAVSAPNEDLRRDDGTLRPLEELRAYFAGRGVDGSTPVGVYCGGGVGATFDAFALHLLGIESAVYVGSWSEWSADERRRVERGNA